jgi:hypothetical protein
VTKKGDFHWTEESQQTFDKMKEVMSTCPILALPNFSQPFFLECDASGVGIGVVLMQGVTPLCLREGISTSQREYILFMIRKC